MAFGGPWVARMNMTATDIVTVPRRTLGVWRATMTLMGLGQATSFAGLGWDYYVHEIVRVTGEPFAALPHLVIFAGIGVTALGFLLALLGGGWRSPIAAG